MNKRIQELAEQATTYIEPVPGHSGEGWIFDKEKFAELIVEECARIVPNTDLGDVDGGDSAVLRAASKQIREHFGVE